MHSVRKAVAVSVLGLLLASLCVSPVFANGGPEPTYGPADVDGNESEWDPTADHFADMYRAANGDKPAESKLYLRYDCSTNTAYALVLAEPDVEIIANLLDDSYIKIIESGISSKVVDGNSGNDGTPPDFEWVRLVLDGMRADGWEASFPLDPGSYEINVHTQIINGQGETSAVEGRAIPLVIQCDSTVNVGPSGFVLIAMIAAAVLSMTGLGLRLLTSRPLRP